MDFTKNTLLLSTKLKMPAPRKNYVIRSALFEKLSMCADMGAIFISGGAGTGKTTLLSSFIRETQLKNVCWLSIDVSNANVYSFWLYFTAALSTFWEDGDSFLSLIRSNPDAGNMENILIMLINRICGEDDYYIVLDDVQYIKDAALVSTIEFFIKAMPVNFHFFMLSREDPPVYLGSLAVSGRLLFIDGKQMQLSSEEGMTFLKNTLQLTACDEELNHINTYAEGWIGGLQLAAAVEAAGRHSGEMLKAGGGIATEYLTREVLEALSQKERDFLLTTGFLSYFDAEICTMIIDGFSRMEFNRIINGLIQKNLFIICIDEQNGLYRYHNILSEYLAGQFEHFPEEQKKELYLKSAGAFEQRSDYEEALRQYCAAGDYDEMLRVAQTMDGKLELWSYLNQVPIEILIENADLAAQCFMYNIGNLDIERCRVIYTEFRKRYGNTDIFKIVQFAEAFFEGDKGIVSITDPLTLPQIDLLGLGPVAKAMILVENSTVLINQMQYEEAENCIQRAIRLCTNIFVEYYTYIQLAQIYEETGRLNDSLLVYIKAKEMIKSSAMMSGTEANYYFGLVGVYMRRMELDKAAKTLEQVQCLMKEQHIHADITDITLYYHLAEMKFLYGDDDSAVSCVERIISEYPKYSVLTLGRLLHELDCAKRLPSSLADDFLEELDRENNYRCQPFMRLLRARLLFERGNTAEAFRETEEILTFSRLHNNKLRLVEAGLLKVYMLLHSDEKSGRHREMNNLLYEAVHYARENKILMPFFLDRSSLLPLLCELSAQSAGNNQMTAAEAAFVLDAMAVCGYSASDRNKKELLSARELDVLSEMSLGITNREIAEKLCISQATVKTHVLSIFGKLGVSSRMSAVDRGRKEGLIE